MSIASFCISSLEPLQVEMWSVAKACRMFPRSTMLAGRSQGDGMLAPVLRVVAHMVAVVCSAVDGSVLEDARGYRVCRAGRVSECGIVVVVEILLCLISAPHLSARPKWQASELITPTCPASSVQWVGGSKPVSSPAPPAASPAPPAASPAPSPAAEGCAGGCAGGEEAGDCS